MAATRRLEPSEHAIQSAFVEWVRSVENLPRYRALRLSFAVVNGARVGIGQARKLKAEGLRAGVPDWWLPYPQYAQKWYGLAIECKTRLGRCTNAQHEYHGLLIMAGWRVEVCRSTEGAIAVVNDYLGMHSA